MGISKMVIGFVLGLSVVTAAATSHASNNCNMRSGVSRNGNTNPTKAKLSKSVAKSSTAVKANKNRGNK